MIKIDKLSPFGSGNPEPKFLLENVRVVKSMVVGEKHVKSILGNKRWFKYKNYLF